MNIRWDLICHHIFLGAGVNPAPARGWNGTLIYRSMKRPILISIKELPFAITEIVSDNGNFALSDMVCRRHVHHTQTDRQVFKKERFLQFSSRSGKRILVGRNALENEELSLRMARGKDLWFHAEAVSGSHVVLFYEKEGDFLEEDIIDAGSLALYFSKLRKEKRGNVHYTPCKYIRKPKGSKPGKIIYHNEKTKWVVLESEILSKLIKPMEQGTNDR